MFPFADIVLGHDARVEITEILVCVRDMLACLATEDAGGLPTEGLVDKRGQRVIEVWWDQGGYGRLLVLVLRILVFLIQIFLS